MTALRDLTGQRFAKLTVLRRYKHPTDAKAWWVCVCECGTKCKVRGACLVQKDSRKATKSCGCGRVEAGRANRTHGKSNTHIYNCWVDMRRRCLDPRRDDYPSYGGRGIKVCKRWMKFENFYADMGEPPTTKHQLDRKDFNGDYRKSNCRWVTVTVQQNNKRNNVLVEVDGKQMTALKASKKLGVSRSQVYTEAREGKLNSTVGGTPRKASGFGRSSVAPKIKRTRKTVQPKLLLIDGNNMAYRYWHVNLRQRDLTKKAMQKQLMAEVPRLSRMLLLGIVAAIHREDPTHVVVCWDGKPPTFRHKLFPNYKAQRKRGYDAVVVSEVIAATIELLRAFQIMTVREPGIEGDDQIGGWTHRFTKGPGKVVIDSRDKDFNSLLSKQVRRFDPTDKVYVNRKSVLERYGVPCSRFRDYLALLGDGVDNIPGVPQIGPKTAVKLIAEYASLDVMKHPRIKACGRKHVKLMSTLVTVRTDLGERHPLKSARLPDLSNMPKEGFALAKKLGINLTNGNFV